MFLFTYYEVSNDHGQQEERNAVEAWTEDAVPHGLDPFAAQDAEDDHERVEEVLEVPARSVTEHLLVVVDAEQLHAHHGEDEDDDHQDEAEVAERAHRPTNNADQQVQRRPRFRQFEHPQLPTPVYKTYRIQYSVA